jgi:hypothetical protein
MSPAQAVLAVLQHKLAEAASSGHSKVSAAAATAAKQQALVAQKEAEGKAAKQLQDAADQVGLPCWGPAGRSGSQSLIVSHWL